MKQWAVLDLETTGGCPGPDRITEVGLVLLDGTLEVGRFQSLVDPERGIPPFITRLTGIDEAMLRGAPTFHQIAESLLEMLQDRVLVAHNVPFDYKFLKHELARCGLAYDPPRLCTVQVGRRLFPGHASYSLGRFAADLGIESFRHHRALGDALACASILQIAVERHGEDKVAEGIKGVLAPTLLPEGWTAERLRQIPDAPGVLWFHGLKGQLLFVTDAASLRVKASHLLSMGKRSPLWAARQGLGDISYELTGNELLARILALQEADREKPSCNKPMRLPAVTGAPPANLLLAGPGRSATERCHIAVRGGRVLGYRFVEQDEPIGEGQVWENLTAFAARPDPLLLVKQQIQRGGGGWRVHTIELKNEN